MTGPLTFHRQHSSTAGCSTVSKMQRSKFRRWSSADESNLSEVTPDDSKKHQAKWLPKRHQSPSDSDSGVEDLDPPAGNDFHSQPTDVDEDEPIANFSACPDEQDKENPAVVVVLDPQEECRRRTLEDLRLAGRVRDDEKKDFCENTMQVFHAEFARQLVYLIELDHLGARYHLFAEDEVVGDPLYWHGFYFIKLDNAKAQFRCPNVSCGRSWTSARSRISFKTSQPQLNGFVVLKIFGQRCECCGTVADALWYMEEVCRVMKNLADEIFTRFFPWMVKADESPKTPVIEDVQRSSRRSRHDPNQRQGEMHAPHNRALCEACQQGLCFA